MDYIPKYIIKRMIKPDGVKKVEGGVEIQIVNIVSAIEITDQVPDNALDYVNADLDGKPVPKDVIANVKIRFEDGEFLITDTRKAKGKILPVGGVLRIFVPVELKVGEEHTFEIKLKEETRFNIQVTRTIV